jgi:hypothetical protein
MKHCLFSIIVVMLTGTQSIAQTVPFSYFQMNIWLGAKHQSIENGFESVVKQVHTLQPDFVSFNEVKPDQFGERIVAALQEKGLTYYVYDVPDCALLSKYPIIESQTFEGPGVSKYLRILVSVQGVEMAIYSLHLDYKFYACYLPRGYDGDSFKDIGHGPIIDEARVLEHNNKSKRLTTIQHFTEVAAADVAKNRVVLVAGDFNEPSHLDWQANTKKLFDHNGAVINWPVSKHLYQEGYRDSYRMLYPNPVKYPGFTWAIDNPQVKQTSSLSWAMTADERDRIDFIYYYPQKGLRVLKTSLVGPKGDIVKGQRVMPTFKDPIVVTGASDWPTDHRGVITYFEWKK